MGSLSRALAIISTTMVLVGCDDSSISGTYIATSSSGAELLELTQPKGGDIIGNLRSINLTRNGEVETLTVNVRGVADGERLTLTLSALGKVIERNFSGTLSGTGLDLGLSGSLGQISTVHFSRGSVTDFNSEAERLTRAGQLIKAEKSKGERVDALNRSATTLEESLNAYVKRANKQIKDTPRFITYFTNASRDLSAKLQFARRLGSGNDGQRAQASGLYAQIGSTEPAIRNTSESVDSGIKEMVQEAAVLNVQLKAIRGNCLGSSPSVPQGEVIPDMGPCKALIAAASDFQAVRGPVSDAHQRLQNHKTALMTKLESIWQEVADAQ